MKNIITLPYQKDYWIDAIDDIIKPICVSPKKAVKGDLIAIMFNVFADDNTANFMETYSAYAMMNKKVEQIIKYRRMPEKSKLIFADACAKLSDGEIKYSSLFSALESMRSPKSNTEIFKIVLFPNTIWIRKDEYNFTQAAVKNKFNPGLIHKSHKIFTRQSKSAHAGMQNAQDLLPEIEFIETKINNALEFYQKVEKASPKNCRTVKIEIGS